PELAVLDVELAGRIIEHDHGYRASDQTVRSVRFHGVCVRCGLRADVFGQRRFGGLVPACRRCARRALEPAAVADALGVPVGLTTDDPGPAPLAKRLQFVLAQLIAPVLILLVTAAVALATGSGVPLACGQLAIVVWLVTVPPLLPPPREPLGLR